MPMRYREDVLGKRCCITFQISPKAQQMCRGRVTKYECSLVGKSIRYRQHVSFDNGDELLLDLQQLEAEGRLQWLMPDIPSAAGAREASTVEIGEPSSKKQKIDKEETVVRGALAEALCLISNMLKDVLPTVVAFVDPSDRNSAALANSHLREAVEIHSKNMLTEVIKEHNVDDTFEDRVRDQTRIRTTRNKPVHLPHRYLLAAAKTTHLYTVVPPAEDQWGEFAVHPSRARLIRANIKQNDHGSAHIYDLATKRCIQSFNFQLTAEQDYWIWKVEYFDTFVLICTSGLVRVFSETGQLLHQFGAELQNGAPNRVLAVENRVLAVERVEQLLFVFFIDRIISFNIGSGASNQIVKFENIGRQSYINVAGICAGRWLVVNSYGTDWPSRAEPKGVSTERILVYDLSKKCSENHWLEGSYSEVKQCTENPSIFYALPLLNSFDRGAHVFELNTEGKLARLSSFPVPVYFSVLCTYRHHLFLKKRLGGVGVVNTRDGKVEGSFGDDEIMFAVQNGTEIFVGRTPADPGRAYNFLSISAFLLDRFL